MVLMFMEYCLPKKGIQGRFLEPFKVARYPLLLSSEFRKASIPSTIFCAFFDNWPYVSGRRVIAVDLKAVTIADMDAKSRNL
jgi:hypothetical protein